MAFIGNTNTTQAFTPAIDYFSGTGSATAFTLSRPVASVAQVQVTIDNVAQNPSSAFTVSANTITFTSAPLSGTNNIYVYYTSPITQVIAPGQGTVGTTQIQNGVTVNFADGTAAAPSITNDGDTNTGIFFPTADTIAFSEGGAESMRIDASGNVGIGTSSPNSRLEALGSTAGAEISRFEGNYSASGTVNLTNWRRSGGAVASVMRYNDANTDMEFGTTTSHSQAFITGGTERMRIDSSGNLLVGKTSVGSTNTGFEVTPASGVPVIRLTSSGTIPQSKIVFYNNSGTYCGEIYTGSGTLLTFANASDYRLKEDVQAMQGALSKVMALKPVTFKWKSDGSFGEGFIAHELQEVVPLAVSRHKDAVDDNNNPSYQAIDQSKLVATLTAAIQELKAINDTQAETINALTARIVALENR